MSLWQKRGRSAAKKQGQRRVLVIDDDPAIIRMLQTTFAHEGLDMISAENGEEGLELLNRAKPDIVILDLGMPGKSGVAFLKEIASSDGKLPCPVVVLTGRAEMGEFFSNLDVNGFLLKPCTGEVVLSEVNKILAVPDAAKPGNLSQRKRGKTSVLLAEDDPKVSQELTSILQEQGFTVSEAHDGSDAIGRAIMETPAVLLLKQVLSGMNGDDVATILRRIPKTHRLPIVLYDGTGYGSSQGDAPVHVKDANVFIKSKDPAELVDAVSQVIAGP